MPLTRVCPYGGNAGPVSSLPAGRARVCCWVQVGQVELSGCEVIRLAGSCKVRFWSWGVCPRVHSGEQMVQSGAVEPVVGMLVSKLERTGLFQIIFVGLFCCVSSVFLSVP